MMKQIIKQSFDEERALYNLTDTEVINCRFAGLADGESVLKEARNITVDGCKFSLRYPMWHVNQFSLVNSSMDDKTRAPLWYAANGRIENCDVTGIKCLRECSHITVAKCNIVSPEFGWRCRQLKIEDSDIDAVYFLFESRQVEIDRLKMTGKYSFQYMTDVHIKNSELDTKDAFWHSKNVTVENSVVKGEYLGWFSENLTLINCRIIGTQPFCYCKKLKLINCTMEGTDLAFEYSDAEADIKGHILSVKNPKSGSITADSIGEIIREKAVMGCSAQIHIRGKNMTNYQETAI